MVELKPGFKSSIQSLHDRARSDLALCRRSDFVEAQLLAATIFPVPSAINQGKVPPMSDATPPPEDPRVRLAGERTLLAWVRTGLAMMGFGFVVARFGLFLRELEAAGATVTAQHS